MMHLNKEQLEAVRHKDGPMLVLAGPGSGKTAVLTEHIRFLVEETGTDPTRILALTFSKKAALQMRHRLGNRMQVCFGTFHSVFYNVLRQYKREQPKLIKQREQFNLLFDIGRKMGIGEIDGAWVMSKLDEIGAYKNTGKIPEYFDEEEEKLFYEISSEYRRRMCAAGLIDFEDMILDCAKLLTTHPAILRELQSRFLHILVDEFQDCNDPQYALLLLLSGRHRNLYCVGDDDQSIYGFRGANSSIVTRLLSDHPDIRTVHLIRNYRCPKAVIEVSDRLIRNNRLRLEKTKQIPSKLRGMGTVTVLSAADANAEAKMVTAKIKSILADHTAEADIAILYRTEMCAVLLKEELHKEHLIDVTQKGNAFFASDAVKEVKAYLSLSQGIYQREFFYRILNHPNRDLVRECVETEIADRDAMLRYYLGDPGRSIAVQTLFSDLAFLEELPPHAAILYIWKKIGLGADYEERRLRQNREELLDAEDMMQQLLDHAKGFRTIKNFLEYLEKERIKAEAQEVKKNETGLILQTIHASKGLEYDTVFVIGLQEGILPHIRAKGMEEKEEERRLLYVAMTRARNRLFLVARGKKECGKRYSSFIDEITE